MTDDPQERAYSVAICESACAPAPSAHEVSVGLVMSLTSIPFGVGHIIVFFTKQSYFFTLDTLLWLIKDKSLLT